MGNAGIPIHRHWRVHDAVVRQTWTRANLAGRYYGGQSGAQTGCGEDNGHYDELDYVDVAHGVDDVVTMTCTDMRNRSVTFTGKYSQSGHMGQVAVTAGSSSGFDMAIIGITGSVFEIESSTAGITGRGHLVLSATGGSCTWDGRRGGVRR
jgi:hypothetical protein